MKITQSWHNDNPNTIWNKLADKLGREPTVAEAADEVRRILDDGQARRAEQGKLPHQRKR